MKQDNKKTQFHGTAVLLKSVSHEPSAVLLRGRSGSGKSDMAFRLIADGGVLICDDKVALERRIDKIYATSVDAIHSLLEVRNVGMLRFPVAEPSRLRLVVDLVAREEVPRIPAWEAVDILGVAIPRFQLYAFDISSALKLRKMMEIAHRPELMIR